jgi:aspartate racemase
MKVIGLLGGMSWESTAEYYRLLNEGVRERLGGLHSAKCVLYSVDFAEIERLRAAGLRRVGLLGTAFTMEQDFYRDRLAGHGLEVLVPGPEDRALVHRVIYEELCLGVVREESRAAYGTVIGGLVASGAQGVILGCTEIELLVRPQDSPVPVFATTRLHAQAAVTAALASASG